MADAMKLVPVEPTEAMIEAGNKALFREFGIRAGKGPLHTLFAAMLAASPPAREEAPAEGAGRPDDYEGPDVGMHDTEIVERDND